MKNKPQLHPIPNNNDTHYACAAIMERDGVKAVCCECSGHECKPRIVDRPDLFEHAKSLFPANQDDSSSTLVASDCKPFGEKTIDSFNTFYGGGLQSNPPYHQAIVDFIRSSLTKFAEEIREKTIKLLVPEVHNKECLGIFAGISYCDYCDIYQNQTNNKVIQDVVGIIDEVSGIKE